MENMNSPIITKEVDTVISDLLPMRIRGWYFFMLSSTKPLKKNSFQSYINTSRKIEKEEIFPKAFSDAS